MSIEYRYPRDGWRLVRVKRAWCPEWLFRWYATLPPWFEPLRSIFTRKVNDEE